MPGKETEHVSGVSGIQYNALECRSFWRAGSDDDFATPAHLEDDKLECSAFERARVHPKFLHSNATSHKWAFGAIAELLDNAIDEICNGATFVKVDRVFNPRDNSPALLFHDNGGGMDPQKMRHCMSLGFSSKKASKMIGQYGNGFKTGTMRLGADAVVFSCSTCEGHPTQSIGILSYTYLMKTHKSDTIVPIVDFKVVDGKASPLVYGSQDDWNLNMRTILDWSPFSSKEHLMMQFNDIGCHGTKVIIHNLWHDNGNRLELDFDDDEEDIQLRDRVRAGNFSQARSQIMESHISFAYRYSLRAYASILYRKKFTSFSIILRGKPVEHLCIADELKFPKVVSYRPYVGKDEMVNMTIGFAKEAPVLGLYGFNIYHRNRLIMPFWKVFQDHSCKGRCIIGVLEANFMEPTHDKQGFEKSMLFNRLEVKLKKTISEYWTTHCHLIGYKSSIGNESIQRASKSSSSSRPNVAQEGTSFQPAMQHSSSSPHQRINLQVKSTVQLATSQAPCFQNEMHPSQPLSGHGVIDGSDGGGSNNAQLNGKASEEYDFGCADDSMTIPGSTYSLHESIPLLDSYSINALSQENARLYIKCQQQQERQKELMLEVEKLEEELQDVRTKCAILVSQLEAKIKQQIA